MRLPALAFLLIHGVAAAEATRVSKTTLKLTYVDYEFAVRNKSSVPTIDWKVFASRPQRIVTRELPAVVLENSYVRVIISPLQGRVHSLIDRATGHEQLWINPAAKPIRAHNDTGFWMTWGGIENVLPRGEHGTSHALRWSYRLIQDLSGRKAVALYVVEPITGLRHALTFSVYSDRPFLETRIAIHNPSPKPRRFSHWTNSVLAPGGRGELTPSTEFIVPADRFVPAEKPFNRWMVPLLGAPHESPLRFAKTWSNIGDLMSTQLQEPWVAAYSHEADEAVIRSLDLARTPGFNIWTWGYPPPQQRQEQYTARPPNLGYVELWTGTVRDYSDEALGTIGAGETIEWNERTCVANGLKDAATRRAKLATYCVE